MHRVRAFLLLLLVAPTTALAQNGPPQVIPANQRDVSPPLRTIPPVARQGGTLEAEPVRQIPSRRNPLGPDPAVQRSRTQASLEAAATIRNFDGVGQGFAGPQGTFVVTSAPPDNNGAVGATQFVEIVNTDLAVFDKATGNPIYGPVSINTLWSGFGGGCQSNNDGDPTVVYDHFANRWIISQFSVSTSPFLQCVAVSVNGDAAGSYYRYSFSYGTQFPDYPKMGVWPDGYYTTYNMFNAAGTMFLGAKVCAFDRARMLTGAAATQVCFSTSTAYGGLLPADVDGSMLPAGGAPNPLIALGASSTTLALWRFHVDYATPSQSTFTGPFEITVPSYTEACGSGGTCIPQNGGGSLDSLSDRLMYRAAYRNFGDHESLVVSHAVTANSSVGVRWYELRGLSTTPTVFQASTWAPDGTYRWMSSLAMDREGNIALGYSASSTAIKPQIRYTGRFVGDAPGLMTQTEGTIFSGAGAQRSTLTRWGDYSSMSIDPVDDCTFWYTNQYLPSTGTFNWRTRIASFRLCGGTAADFTLTTAPASLTIQQQDTGATTVSTTATGGFSGNVALSVSGVPAGANASFAQPTIAAGGSTTLTINPGPAAPGTYTLTVTGTSGALTHSSPVTLTITAAPTPDFSLSASPASLSLAPAAGGTSTISVVPTNGFNASVALSVSGVPAGATASLSPTSTASTSTLTVNAGTAAAGSYPLTITAMSGSLSHSTTVTLTVTVAGTFALSSTPSSKSVARGSSTTVAITIARTNFSDAVSLSPSGLPDRVTATFNPNPVSASVQTSTLTIAVANGAKRGTYTVTVTGVGGGITKTTSVALTIN